MALHVVPDPLPPEVLAEDEPHHVEDARGLVVRVRVEHVLVVVVLRRHDRAAVRLRVLLEVPVRLLVHHPVELVLSELGLEPHGVEVRREPLVQPEVVPRFRREEVPEPLVGELVCEEALGPVVGPRVRVYEAVLDEDREGRVLHPAEREVPHHRLRVLRPRIFLARGLREERHHRGDELERVLDLRALPLRHVVLEGDALPHLLLTIELPAHERDQVVHVGDVLEPVVRAGLVGCVMLLLEEPAVRDRELLLGDRDDDLRGQALVRGVVRGEPRAVVLLLALGPHHPRALRIRFRGPDEEHPLPGAGVVRDLQGELGVRLVRPSELDPELVRVILELEGPALLVRDLSDVEVLPVKVDVPQPVVQWAQEEGRGSADLSRLLVQYNVEPDVAEVERAVPGEVFRRGLLREDLVERSDRVRPAEEKRLHALPAPVVRGSKRRRLFRVIPGDALPTSGDLHPDSRPGPSSSPGA